MNKIDHVDRLLELSGQDFINALYWLILGRAPDQEGSNAYMNRLNMGDDKRDILVSVALSAEGQNIKADLPGLATEIEAARRERLPLIGVFFRIKMLVTRILRQVNRSELRLAFVESQISYRLIKIESEIYNLSSQIEETRVDCLARVHEMEERVSDKLSKLDVSHDNTDVLDSIASTSNSLKQMSEGGFAELWLKINHLSSVASEIKENSDAALLLAANNESDENSDFTDKKKFASNAASESSLPLAARDIFNRFQPK